MDAKTALEFQWPYLLSLVGDPARLEESARAHKALVRRRGIRSAHDLLRISLAYANCGLSLRTSAAWAEASEVASLSDVALLKRIRHAEGWLGAVLTDMVDVQVAKLERQARSWRLRLVDATCVSKPGSVGTDWRIHVSWDLGAAVIDGIEVTDEHGGESLTRFGVIAGELVIADRGYAHRAGLHSVVASGGDFIVRLPWQRLPLTTRDDKPFDLLENLRELKEAEPASFAVRVPAKAGTPAFDARLVCVRKSEVAAAASRDRILKEASKKQHKVDPRTLEAASYVFVLTSLTDELASAYDVLEMYRFRWQIELKFKRMKSVLRLDTLPARDPRLARAWLYSQLIGALLLERFSEAHLAFSPWGFRATPALAVAAGVDAR